ESLAGRTFLDAGCGSGLFSLAARNLGARVRSFDFDRDSVSTTMALRDRFRPDDPDWIVGEGSVLEPEFLAGLGTFDVVYCWGVLHHTGEMWRGLDNVIARVGAGGQLFVSIYNRQAVWTHVHTAMKRAYVQSGPIARTGILAGFAGFQVARSFAADALRLRNPVARYLDTGGRGMSVWHDWVDWVGGYPYEVATPEQVFEAVVAHGFVLTTLRTCGGHAACNQFVFRRTGAP
ncbi:MAG TPA: class I SAM-dependent methyltransferase, partial [Nannocystaceae bacterium]|nr:class I SAM-dependent methyltransferase [Nannocystaceae bacterium]